MRTLGLLAALLAIGPVTHADDWPQWRGPRRDGVSNERGWLAGWPEGAPPVAWRRQGGRLNVLFCDGHVEGPRLKEMFVDRSAEALRRWNADHLPH
jgi:prepilin-type processing-associated H-X9-DG protein